MFDYVHTFACSQPSPVSPLFLLLPHHQLPLRRLEHLVDLYSAYSNMLGILLLPIIIDSISRDGQDTPIILYVIHYTKRQRSQNYYKV